MKTIATLIATLVATIAFAAEPTTASVATTATAPAKTEMKLAKKKEDMFWRNFGERLLVHGEEEDKAWGSPRT